VGEWINYIHVFLTSALVGGEWSASHPSYFTPGERSPGSHCIGGWVDPRAALDDVDKRKFLTLPGLELWHFDRPACCQPLYRLSYLGSCGNIVDLCKLPSKEIEGEVVDLTRLTQNRNNWWLLWLGSKHSDFMSGLDTVSFSCRILLVIRA
jgi:hypothetical protein